MRRWGWATGHVCTGLLSHAVSLQVLARAKGSRTVTERQCWIKDGGTVLQQYCQQPVWTNNRRNNWSSTRIAFECSGQPLERQRQRIPWWPVGDFVNGMLVWT